MVSARRIPLLIVLAVALVATGLLTSWRHASNPSSLPSGLSISLDAESTALYCTGLSSQTGSADRVVFVNTSDASRALRVSIVSDKGATWSGSLELAAYASQSLSPSTLVTGNFFGVAVQISGGGVVGEEIEGSNHTQVPCSASGVTHWYDAGLSTSVGSSAYVSIYNPTATAAVLNASIFTTSGVSMPDAFQGLSIPAHTESEIKLASEVVNTSNIGVAIDVLRGSLEIVGTQDSSGVLSLNAGTTQTSADAWYPNVTTANKASATLLFANPGADTATVTVDVSLGSFKVPSQSVTIAPYSVGSLAITPNSAIPAAGYANLRVRSNQPIFTSLATGTSTGTALSAPESPADSFLIRDLTGLGFDVATLTNTSSRALTFSITSLNAATPHAITSVGGITLAGGATANLASTNPAMLQASDVTYIVSSTRDSLVVGITLPSSPAGIDLAVPLDGR
jgi:hypothetical protein